MPIVILCFLLGDMVLQQLSALPAAYWVYSSMLLAMGVFYKLSSKRRYLIYPLAIILGFSWTCWYAKQVQSWVLAEDAQGKPLMVTGHIASLPVTDSRQTSFLFQLDAPSKPLVRLVERHALTSFNVGDHWQFQVKLKRIHGMQNSGGFDFEAWALQKGLRASGYILQEKFIKHDKWFHPVDQIREHLQSSIMAHLPVVTGAEWLPALMIGERSHISPNAWQVLRHTGTNHLMAIAGLHIGLISGMAAFIGSWLWRQRTGLCLRLPAQQVAACMAWVSAVIYAALSGFSIPAQRACIMLSVFVFALLLKRKVNLWHVWSIAMGLILLMNPLTVLTESFWLSFVTIALLIYAGCGRLRAEGFWLKHTRPQWVIGLGLMPLSLWFFQEWSLVAFLANMIAIPWLGILVLPFCVASAIFLFIYPPIGHALLYLAAKSFSGLWWLLTALSHWQFAIWHQAISSSGILLLTLTGCLLLLLPKGVPLRGLGVFLCFPLLMRPALKPAQGEYWLTLLDVGQGLSAVVRTASHTLVYDAGAKFNDNVDMGESVVLPYLRAVNRQPLDMLVVSHGDNDHIGGAGALLAALPVHQIKTSVPERFSSHPASRCLAGDRFVWDGVVFHFIYPNVMTPRSNNDSSCVLRIDNGVNSVLLTGDIEKAAEKALLLQAPSLLQATILIAPHHGSKTSGLPAFIQSVHPAYVLYATGYRNRYHFPHPTVVAQYQARHVIQLNTEKTGQIDFRLNREGLLHPPQCYRQGHPHYWFNKELYFIR